MPRSPPLALNHPEFYFTEDGMENSPATASAAIESLTAIPLDPDAGEPAGPSASSDPPAAAKPEKKRRRPALSCEQCRKRKIRCDRGLPCVNCVKSKITPCTYAPTHIPASRTKKAVNQTHEAGSDRSSHILPRPAPGISSDYTKPSSSEHIRQGPQGCFIGSHTSPSIRSSTVGSTSGESTVEALRARIHQLEHQLANDFHISRNTDDKFVPHKEDENVPMKGTISKTRFFGQSHWMNGIEMFPTILTILTQTEAQRIEPYTSFVKCKSLGRTIKEHRVKPISTNNLGQTVPARSLADQLVDAYFNTFEGSIRILHAPTFRVEYERYWQNPRVASDVFVMQLQLVMAIGATMYDDQFTLRTKAMQWVHEAQVWLLLPPEKSRMTIAGIQIMCMLVIAKATCAVGQDLTWVTAGSLVRQAMYMGLHRDPKHLADMSVYRAEMRRRLWATIMELNLGSSYDAGGPPLISGKHYDTLPPANLNDDQLTDEPDSKAPSSNPNELTDMSVQLALFKSLPLRLAILKHVNEFRSKDSYSETLRLNSELTKACRTMTETLASLTQAQKHNSRTIITSFHSSHIQLFLYRCFISLHQPMIARVSTDPTFYYSRKVSLDCSLKMAQICDLCTPPSYAPTPAGLTTPDKMFRRLITNGAGVYRTLPSQVLLAVALEYIKKKEEQRESLGGLSMGSTELRLVLDAALVWTEQRIRSGETNVKGHCFTAACVALADSIEMNLSEEDTNQAVINVGARVSINCCELLKEVAEREGAPVNTDEAERPPAEMEGVETMESFMDMPFDWMGDMGWDGMGGFSWGRNVSGMGGPREFGDMDGVPQMDNPPF